MNGQRRDPTDIPEVDQRGFIRRHLAGDYPLWRAFWLHNVALQWTMAALVIGLQGLLAETTSARVGSMALVLFYPLTLLVWLWGVIGAWASASHHPDRGGSSGWAMAAKVFIVLGALRTIADAGMGTPLLFEHLRVAFGRPVGTVLHVETRDDGRTLVLSGGIQDGAADTLETALKAAPNVRTVVLDSEGGFVREGERIAQVIRQRKLDTHVETLCASSCTLALLGGVHRTATPQARIGFHAPRTLGSTGARRIGLLTNPRMRRFYAEAGLPATFIETALRTPADDVWFPTADELLEARVLTGRPDPNPPKPPPRFASRQAMDAALQANALFAAVAQREPAVWAQALDDAWNATQAGATEADLQDTVRARVLPAARAYVPHTSDAALIDYQVLMKDQLVALRSRDARACVLHAFPTGERSGAAALLPPELMDRETALLAGIVRGHTAVQALPDGAQRDQLARQVLVLMTAEQQLLLQQPAERQKAHPANVCAMAEAWFTALGRMPQERRAAAVRVMLSA